jgi:hypothetical protein
MTYEPDDDSLGVASRSRWLTPKPRHYTMSWPSGERDAMIAAIALVAGVGESLRGSWWGPAMLAFALFEIREAYLKRLAGNWSGLSDLYREWLSRRSSRSEQSPGGSAASPTVARRGVYLLIGAPLLLVGVLALSHGIIEASIAALCGAVLIGCAIRGTTF